MSRWPELGVDSITFKEMLLEGLRQHGYSKIHIRGVDLIAIHVPNHLADAISSVGPGGQPGQATSVSDQLVNSHLEGVACFPPV